MPTASHRLRAHEVVHAGCAPPLKRPCCGQDDTGAESGNQAQLHPLCGSQAVQQTPPPVAQGALQRQAPGLRPGPRLREEGPQASRAPPAPWPLLGVRERQRLGGQQDQSHGHLRKRGDSAAKREHQQREQEAVLLRDHVPRRPVGELQLPGDRREALELQLHQLTHVRASADFLQEPGGVEAHTHQRCLRVRAEPQVLAAVRAPPSHAHGNTQRMRVKHSTHTDTTCTNKLLILGSL